MLGGGLGPCGWRGQGQENREEAHLVFAVFGCWKHRFTLSSRYVVVFFHHVSGS